MTEEQWRKRVHRAIRAGRKTAEDKSIIWAACVAYSADNPGWSSASEWDDTLAKYVRRVEALSLCAKYACEEAGLDFHETYLETIEILKELDTSEISR